MDQKQSTNTTHAQSEIPMTLRQTLQRLNSKERQQLLLSLTEGGSQRVGIFNKDLNVFYQFI